jgi:hypothetical protein
MLRIYFPRTSKPAAAKDSNGCQPVPSLNASFPSATPDVLEQAAAVGLFEARQPW